MNCKGTEKYASLCVIYASNFNRWFADAITFPPEGKLCKEREPICREMLNLSFL